MLIYVAGAIDKASVSDYGFDELQNVLLMAHARRHDIDEALQLFIPARGWVVNGKSTVKNAETLIALNMKIVENADVMVVRYDRGVETWGTPMEVQLASHNAHIPIYVWSKIEDSAGNRPDYVNARDLLPTYLLPYAHDKKVWCNLDLLAEKIMKEYTTNHLNTEPTTVFQDDVENVLDMLRRI